ncbi:MAG TPA: hypothetical protein VFE58_05005 [Tepidisphaeraceae bacterium]|jgi:hypothetical protein|nr:hypothetical protein [Tepidisphaeraceae bacterium]
MPSQSAGGVVYHILNRGNLKGRFFYKEGDYAAFEGVLAEAVKRGGWSCLRRWRCRIIGIWW